MNRPSFPAFLTSFALLRDTYEAANIDYEAFPFGNGDEASFNTEYAIDGSPTTVFEITVNDEVGEIDFPFSKNRETFVAGVRELYELHYPEAVVAEEEAPTGEAYYTNPTPKDDPSYDAENPAHVFGRIRYELHPNLKTPAGDESYYRSVKEAVYGPNGHKRDVHAARNEAARLVAELASIAREVRSFADAVTGSGPISAAAARPIYDALRTVSEDLAAKTARLYR